MRQHPGGMAPSGCALMKDFCKRKYCDFKKRLFLDILDVRTDAVFNGQRIAVDRIG